MLPAGIFYGIPLITIVGLILFVGFFLLILLRWTLKKLMPKMCCLHIMIEILFALGIALLLVATFFYGGGAELVKIRIS